jgi:hypothetical protein
VSETLNETCFVTLSHQVLAGSQLNLTAAEDAIAERKKLPFSIFTFQIAIQKAPFKFEPYEPFFCYGKISSTLY